jgi:D-tyrosyl-tRNA(Tyr) deacylase
MRVVLQRVKSSRVEVEGRVVGQIQRGFNLLVGFTGDDTPAAVDRMARKCLEVRVFPDDRSARGGFDRSIQEIGGGILAVSQFTLYADCTKGRRPSFLQAARPDQAEPLYDQFVDRLRQSGLAVSTGIFGAMMDVFIENDGPVTLILDGDH